MSVPRDVSLDGSGDSSSPSKKTTEQRSSATVLPTALTPSGDKSESSEIQEDISQVVTDVTSQSELRLKLHDVTNDDFSDGGVRSNLVTPRSDVVTPRSDIDVATPRSDDYTTPRTDSKVAPTSARSLSEIAEEYSVPIHTDVSSKGDVSHVSLKGDVSHVSSKGDASHRQISSPVKSTTEPSLDVKSVAPSVETSVTEAQEEGKDEGAAHSESGSSRTLTEDSRSERSEKSEHSSSSSKTYSQDFSSEGTETGQSTRTEEASRDEESIKTEEDISEEFSVEPDSGESSPRVVDLTAEVKTDEGVLADLEEGRRVLVGGVKSGTLRFKGKVEFAPGVWAGVELDDSEGTNDGTKDGVTYFSCRSGHGLFVPPDKITDHPLQDRTETVSTHDDIVLDTSKASLPDEESAAKTKSSSRDVLTPPIDLQTPPIELVDDEQTADDVSIATVDSELERVISSADAGVTAFELDMSAEAEMERVLTQESDVDTDAKPEIENKVPAVPDTDVIAHGLLTEAISEILNIRRQKREQLTHDVPTVSDDSPYFFTTEIRDTEDSDRLISLFERPSTPLGHVTPDEALNKQVSVMSRSHQLSAEMLIFLKIFGAHMYAHFKCFSPLSFNCYSLL